MRVLAVADQRQLAGLKQQRAETAQQPAVVALEESIHARRVEGETRGRERTLHEDGCPFSDHRDDGRFGQRGSAPLGDQGVGGVCKVLPGVDERAIEVEDDQAR